MAKSPIPIEGNGSRESHHGDGYGKQGEPSFTLNAVEHHAVAYGISAYASNSMKSGNPHSGIYKADTSRTLDLNGGSPACNQGGMAIVHSNNSVMISKGLDLYNHEITGDVAATMNATSCDSAGHSGPSVMVVGCDIYNQELTGQIAPSLTAASGGTNTSGPKVMETIRDETANNSGNMH